MSDPLSLRMQYRLKFLDSVIDRRLMLEAIEVVSGVEATEAAYRADVADQDGALRGADVLAWLDAKGISTLKWQRAKLEEL